MARKHYIKTLSGVRADGTFFIYKSDRGGCDLGAKLRKDGTATPFIEYYLGYKRTVNETTGKATIYPNRYRVYYKDRLFYYPAKTPSEKIHNENTKSVLINLVAEKNEELKNQNDSLSIIEKLQIEKQKKAKGNGCKTFFDVYQDYIDTYTKKDIRDLKISCKWFKDFIESDSQYDMYKDILKPQQIDKDMVAKFADYIKNRSKTAEGANTVYARFKKVIKYAVEHDIITKNPCTGIVIKNDANYLRKEVLSPEELQLLANCHYENESDNIRRAFLFCCLTGLAFVDVKALTYEGIDIANRTLTYTRAKTGIQIIMNLSDTHLNLLGDVSQITDRTQKVFDLKTYESCLKSLHRWVKRAGINKHISWHCARHTFGTNLTANGTNPFVTQNLMGHTTLKYTQRYVRAFDEAKKAAINTLPAIEL